MRIEYLAAPKGFRPLATDTARMIRRHRDRNKHRRIICDYRVSHPLCQRCLALGRTSATAEIHHIRPVADGGETAGRNLLALCLPCHLEIPAIPQQEQEAFKRY